MRVRTIANVVRYVRSRARYSTRAPVGREYLVGTHSVSGALSSNSRTILRLYVARTAGSGDRDAVDAVVEAASKRSVPVIWTDRQHVHNLAGGPASVVMDVRALSPPTIDDAASLTPWHRDSRDGDQSPLVVALDQLTDPHNVGAIIRSALLLQADWILASARSAAPFNATVSKVSSGALEVFAGAGRLGITESMPALLSDCCGREWRVLGAAAPPAERGGQLSGGGASSTFRQWIPSSTLRRAGPTVLVLGSEGSGLHPAVARACSAFVHIPMSDSSSGKMVSPSWRVDSFNVSAAAAILLHQLRLSTD